MHLAGAAAFLALAGGVFWYFARDKGDKLSGNSFSASQFQQNFIGMRGNKYVVTGTIAEQLRISEDRSRLFSMEVKDDGAAEAIPIVVLVPPKFSAINIQVGQEFQMSGLVDRYGVFTAEDIRKS